MFKLRAVSDEQYIYRERVCFCLLIILLRQDKTNFIESTPWDRGVVGGGGGGGQGGHVPPQYF